ncbi:MAG: MBOAT family protein [Flavobacteriaceae bacterium]|nr:MBOAT family protein [Flavobacteriaceae bacterium]
MLFNSFDFGFFLVIVYLAYWAIGSKRRTSQNILLLLASYTFYGLWDWRFLGLLIASSLVDFIAARTIENSNKNTLRKIYLWLSITWNLGVLFTFKYFNFFLENFNELFGIAETQGYNFWNVVIPVGLSFYTFQTMSYTIDVYRKKQSPTTNLLEFLCFVSFFPQLVAGPIEKARHLLPQFEKKRIFKLDETIIGLRQILWGLFKKIIVAEKLGIAVTMAFSAPESYHGLTLLFACVLFCFQVYCDFSGYTDIAIGTARLFGFKLSINFNLPYLSRSLSEFWQRWHITLTRWFTDYVYIPIVKSARKITDALRAFGLLITMTLVGLWHGANWTFICFGIFNGIVLVLERIPIFRNKKNLQNKLQGIPRIMSLVYLFMISSLSALLFRAIDIEQAGFILKKIVTFTSNGAITTLIGYKLLYLVFLLAAEVYTRKWEFPLEKLESKISRPARWVIYYALIIIIIRYAEPKEAFIYFQF